MKNMKQRKAFTIVEMVIVIAVIAILATVLIPTISGVIKKANISADTQFAASLNIQLAMWEADPDNGKIESEDDLREAFAAFYEDDFYDNLTPKSGKHGYHYWYDAEAHQVVLGTYEDLVNSEDGQVHLDADGEAAVAQPEYKFEAANPRSLMVQTKTGWRNYFLMDQAGTELADYLADVNNIAAVGDHATIIGNIDLIADDAALADLVADKLSKTAVANNYGLFFDSGVAEYVYIPMNTTQLGEANVRGDLSGVTEIYLPDGVKLGSNSLEGFTVTGTDYMQPDTWVGSTVIYANIPADQVSSFISTNAFDCVLEIPTGERYVFVGGQLKQLGSNENYTTSYSTALESFVVTGTDNEKADMHFGVVNEIHYAADYTGTFTLQVQDFVDENGACPARPVTWEGVGDAVANPDGSITLTNAQLKAATTIVVRSTDGVEYTFNVKAVAVDGVSLKVNNVSNVSNQFSFEYNSTGVTYTLAATVYVTDNITCVKPSITPAISIDGILEYDTVNETEIVDGSGNAAYQYTTTLSFVNAKQTGDVAANLSVTAGSVSRTGTISLKDTIQTAFVIADNANTQTKYGIQFTVGTVNAIRLDTLFAPATSDALNGRTEISYTAKIGSVQLSSGSNLTAETWKSTTLDLSSVDSDGTLTVVIHDGLKSTTFTAAVKAGAYNVTDGTTWGTAGNKIVILKDVVLGDITVTDNENQSYVKSITYLNGNYNVIDATKYSYKSSSHAYVKFIGITSAGSLMENVVINGPVYPEVVLSGASSGGYFTPGVRIGGGTPEKPIVIKNSYISGFSAPLRYDSGVLSVVDSVLDGGVKCNLYVYGSGTITLNNVQTVQKPGGYATTFGTNKKVLGAGIYIDTAANGTTINLSGNTQHYNWICQSDNSYGGNVKTIIDELFTRDKTGGSWLKPTYGPYYVKSEFAQFAHTINDTAYLNAAIVHEFFNYENRVINNGTSFAYTSKVVTNKYDGTFVDTNGFFIYSYEKCDACSHNLIPDSNEDGVYNYGDFCFARYTDSYKATIAQ